LFDIEENLISGANAWVNEHWLHFFNTKKSTLELLEFKLFQSDYLSTDVDFAPLVAYSQETSKNDTIFRELERLAIENLLLGTSNLSTIHKTYTQSFIHHFITDDIPLTVLMNRETAYTLTHTFFYGSIFDQNLIAIPQAERKNAKSMEGIKLAISEAIRSDDVGVLAELLCVVEILKARSSLHEDVIELGFLKMAASQNTNGSVRSGENGHSDDFPDVYHTTLVLRY